MYPMYPFQVFGLPGGRGTEEATNFALVVMSVIINLVSCGEKLKKNIRLVSCGEKLGMKMETNRPFVNRQFVNIELVVKPPTLPGAHPKDKDKYRHI